MGDLIDARVDRTSPVPIGTQLVEQIRAAVEDGRLKDGDRLPSVRELARSAGVNVNTVRAVYARLDAAGVVRSEHGRGTFVADVSGRAPGEVGAAGARLPGASGAAGARPPGRPGAAGAPPLSRAELREQIASLEATLARLPPPPLGAGEEEGAPAAALLSTGELLAVRDRLVERLEQLDTERTALIESLEQLGVGVEDAKAPADVGEPRTSRRATPSLAGARIRWVGA
jgi:GntR family transcriptional regulator